MEMSKYWICKDAEECQKENPGSYMCAHEFAHKHIGQCDQDCSDEEGCPSCKQIPLKEYAVMRLLVQT